MGADKLTPKQRLFVLEYLVDLNATQASIRAGYSAKTAEVQGPRLLGNVRVKAEIAKRMKSREEKVVLKADDVLRELLTIAKVDIRRAFDADGNLLPVKDLPEDVARAIGGIEIDEIFDGNGKLRVRIGQTKKIKFWDKNKALESLGRHLKLFTDNVQLGGEVKFTQMPSIKINGKPLEVKIG